MKILKKDIVSKIEKRKNNSLWEHFLTSLDVSQTLFGEVERNKVFVWNWSAFLGSFYPVFTFEFNENNELVKISDQLNTFGKLLCVFILFLFSYAFGSLILNDFNIIKLVFIGSIYVVFLTVLMLIGWVVYRFEKNETKEYYFRLFDIEENTK